MGRFCTGRPQQVSVTMQAVSVRFCVSILCHFSGSQRGVVLFCRGRLATSGDIFLLTVWWWGAAGI